jgi:hypothetical protein
VKILLILSLFLLLFFRCCFSCYKNTFHCKGSNVNESRKLNLLPFIMPPSPFWSSSPLHIYPFQSRTPLGTRVMYIVGTFGKPAHIFPNRHFSQLSFLLSCDPTVQFSEAHGRGGEGKTTKPANFVCSVFVNYSYLCLFNTLTGS